MGMGQNQGMDMAPGNNTAPTGMPGAVMAPPTTPRQQKDWDALNEMMQIPGQPDAPCTDRDCPLPELPVDYTTKEKPQ